MDPATRVLVKYFCCVAVCIIIVYLKSVSDSCMNLHVFGYNARLPIIVRRASIQKEQDGLFKR